MCSGKEDIKTSVQMDPRLTVTGLATGPGFGLGRDASAGSGSLRQRRGAGECTVSEAVLEVWR